MYDSRSQRWTCRRCRDAFPDQTGANAQAHENSVKHQTAVQLYTNQLRSMQPQPLLAQARASANVSPPTFEWPAGDPAMDRIIAAAGLGGFQASPPPPPLLSPSQQPPHMSTSSVIDYAGTRFDTEPISQEDQFRAAVDAAVRSYGAVSVGDSIIDGDSDNEDPHGGEISDADEAEPRAETSECFYYSFTVILTDFSSQCWY